MLHLNHQPGSETKTESKSSTRLITQEAIAEMAKKISFQPNVVIDEQLRNFVGDVYAGNIGYVKAALARTPSLINEKFGKRAISALGVAVQRGNLKMVDLLLKSGADVTEIVRMRFSDKVFSGSVLHEAILAFDKINSTNRDKKNSVNNHGTTFFKSDKEAMMIIIRLLQEKNCDINLKTTGDFYLTPLDLVITLGLPDLVKLLLSWGASMESECARACVSWRAVTREFIRLNSYVLGCSELDEAVAVTVLNEIYAILDDHCQKQKPQTNEVLMDPNQNKISLS